MKNTVGHTGIYAWGDCVRHRFFQKLRSNRRTKNPPAFRHGECQLELKGDDSDVEIEVTLKKSLLRAVVECAEEQEVTIDEFISAALFDYCSANYGE